MASGRVVEAHKKCRRCGEVKPRGAFTRVTGLPNAVQSLCRICCAAVARERYAKLPKEHTAAINRRSKLKRTYGITVPQFNALLDKQGGRCAICGTDKPKGKGNQFHVDHCHDSGKVRGLLCTACNVGIGNLKDDPALLLKAARYLQLKGGANLGR